MWIEQYLKCVQNKRMKGEKLQNNNFYVLHIDRLKFPIYFSTLKTLTNKEGEMLAMLINDDNELLMATEDCTDHLTVSQTYEDYIYEKY